MVRPEDNTDMPQEQSYEVARPGDMITFVTDTSLDILLVVAVIAEGIYVLTGTGRVERYAKDAPLFEWDCLRMVGVEIKLHKCYSW